MAFNNIIASLALSALMAATGTVATERDLTVCDTLKSCSLINIQTRKELVLTGSDSFELDPLNTHGYSIRCDVNGANSLDFIKFFYDGEEQTEFGEPRFMNGDSNKGAYINDVKYLSTCGKKTLTIEGNVWSNPCFKKEFVIDVTNNGGKPCTSGDTKAPMNPPTNAPMNLPTNAPMNLPTSAPVKPPTNAPMNPPTRAPVKQPTRAPVQDPTRAPVKDPTRAPVKDPTRAPVKDPTRAPVKPPTRAPVKPPTRAPVKPPTRAPIKVCLPSQVLVNGVCQDVCKNDYQCPVNSFRIANRDCYDNFDDCACNNGYYKASHDAKCLPIKVCSYPQVLVNGVCQNVCKNDYQCPTNSYRIAHRLCYDNFDDCACNHGYYKASHDAKCLPIKVCPYPQVLVNGVCQNVCKNDYQCPTNSYRIAHRLCYDNFDDCACNHGYYKASHDAKCMRHSWWYW